VREDIGEEKRRKGAIKGCEGRGGGWRGQGEPGQTDK